MSRGRAWRGPSRRPGDPSSASGCRSFAAFQVLELFADLRLEPALGGPVPLLGLHALGKIGFARGIGAFLVVRVAVALAVAELLHEAGGRVAQVRSEERRVGKECR